MFEFAFHRKENMIPSSESMPTPRTTIRPSSRPHVLRPGNDGSDSLVSSLDIKCRSPFRNGNLALQYWQNFAQHLNITWMSGAHLWYVHRACRKSRHLRAPFNRRATIRRGPLPILAMVVHITPIKSSRWLSFAQSEPSHTKAREKSRTNAVTPR